jgi:hypothetical protein
MEEEPDNKVNSIKDCTPRTEGTPARLEKQKESLSHYKNFVKKAYNVVVPDDCFDRLQIDDLVITSVSKTVNSKALTPQELLKRIHIIQHWENGSDGIDAKNFCSDNHIGYRLIQSKMYVSAHQDGTEHMYNNKNQVYVHVLQVFDKIAECHSQVGCLKTAATKNAVDAKYANITREEVNAFVQTCKYCSHDKVATTKHSGAIKPIISHNFCDRFQVR